MYSTNIKGMIRRYNSYGKDFIINSFRSHNKYLQILEKQMKQLICKDASQWNTITGFKEILCLIEYCVIIRADSYPTVV